MKYEHTHLSVRVTATGNTAREMSRWSDAARTEYLCDQVVMFLNGRRPDFCVECLDLKAVEFERAQRAYMTGGDFVGGAIIEIEKPNGEVEFTTAEEIAGHAKVADELDAEALFEPVGTVPVVGDTLECVHVAEGFHLKYKVGDKFHIGRIDGRSAYPTEGPVQSIGFLNTFVGNTTLGRYSSHFRILKRRAGGN